MKTFIRWYGNKSKYIKFILLHFPISYNTYIEPFVGSGALFLNLQPKKWIINDLNTDITTLWKIVQTSHIKMLNRIKLFEKKLELLSADEKKNIFQKLQKKFLK